MAITTTKPAGTWQYEDLFDLPDDGRRYEIIRGELYEMPGPEGWHAVVIYRLVVLLSRILDPMGGLALSAVLDVFVRDGNPVQPDIVVLLADRVAQLRKRGVEGAPNLVVEVLSPSNPAHDLILKRDLYAKAGILEYWIVDLEARTIEVLVLEDAQYRTHVRASGDDVVTSPTLSDLAFPASAAFIGISASFPIAQRDAVPRAASAENQSDIG